MLYIIRIVYGAYDHLGEGIVHSGCLSHARRGFYKAHQVAKEDPLPLEVMGEIARLYKVEQEARSAKMSFQQRLALRQERSRPIMEHLKERIVAFYVGPKADLTKYPRVTVADLIDAPTAVSA